ncbi:MAG: phosphoribosyltransferase [Nitrospirae bacterium RBG_16_43_8]|nr:MAG: phosphoribosyltransferase [Nitrospirae bacterium RBG_16_43_8]
MLFKDRSDAALKLASKLMHYKDRADVIVLALPRGGVVTGYEISKELNCPLDIIIIRKIGFPGQPELAIGAVSETGAVILNEDMVSSFRIPENYIDSEIKKQEEEISRRKILYRGGKGIPELDGKVIILVDDGVATGATMKAAIAALKTEKIKHLVVAVPVASPDSAENIKAMVDEWVCLDTPYYFTSVGSFYRDFSQVSDDEVVELLKEKAK